MIYKIGIVEDEYYAQRVMINLLEKYKHILEISHVSSSVEEAKKDIATYQPDIVFLDIELPGGNGFDVINCLKNYQIKVIFTTAYEKFAIKAFEASAIDYVLKPILPDRLAMAIERAVHQLKTEKEALHFEGLKSNLESNTIQKITIKYKDSYRILDVSNILYFKAEGAYTTIQTVKERFLQSHKLNYYETMFLESPWIIRVHRSWMIHAKFITRFSKSRRSITVGSQEIPVSKTNKKEVFDFLTQNIKI